MGQLLLSQLPGVLLLVLSLVASAIPVALPFWLRQLRADHRALLLGAVKGAYFVVAAVAAKTPTDLDDAVAKIIKQVELEIGKLSAKDVAKVKAIALALHADPSKPNLK